MLILLDEQLPKQLARTLVGHNVRTVQQQGWAGLKNGTLLARADATGFDILLTGDQNMHYQQNLAGRKIAIVVLCGMSTALEDLLPLVPNALDLISRVRNGEVHRVTV